MLFANIGWNSPGGSWNEDVFSHLLKSPLGKGRDPSFEQTWIYITQGWFVPRLVKIGSAVLENKKMCKDCDNDDDDNDGQIVIRKPHLSLRLRWANKKLLQSCMLSWVYREVFYRLSLHMKMRFQNSKGMCYGTLGSCVRTIVPPVKRGGVPGFYSGVSRHGLRGYALSQRKQPSESCQLQTFKVQLFQIKESRVLHVSVHLAIMLKNFSSASHTRCI